MRELSRPLVSASAMSLGILFSAISGACAQPSEPVRIVLKDHHFSPASVTVRNGERVQIEVTNQDAAYEEFDSRDLRVEKGLPPRGKATFKVGPLKPGAYRFMGELHSETATGVLVVEPQR